MKAKFGVFCLIGAIFVAVGAALELHPLVIIGGLLFFTLYAIADRVVDRADLTPKRYQDG